MQARYVAHWKAVCECKRPISFSPNKPLVQDEHEYKCQFCGTKYYIDRTNGTYIAL